MNLKIGFDVEDVPIKHVFEYCLQRNCNLDVENSMIVLIEVEN